MHNDTLFQSDRLTLRRLTNNDAGFIFELLNTPSWKTFIGDRNINTTEDAANYIQNVLVKFYDRYAYGPWTVVLKTTLRPIGICGLFKRDYLDRPDLGFAFLPEHEGRGLAYEASTASIDYVKKAFALDKIYATTTAANLRSQRLLTRCGFTWSGMVAPPGGNESLWLYTLGF